MTFDEYVHTLQFAIGLDWFQFRSVKEAAADVIDFMTRIKEQVWREFILAGGVTSDDRMDG